MTGGSGWMGVRPRALAIVGPTASGKTSLSLPVARRLDGEIISMDSRQVYRGMDVGTDKASTVSRREIPHHGVDLLNPGERYSAGRFGRDARQWIQDIESRRRLPILVGGTGFFLRALTDPIFREPPMDAERRERLRRWLSARSLEDLQRWVRVLDPERAPVAEAGGLQRMTRTLEVALLTGHPLSWWHRTAAPDGAAVPVAVAWIDVAREELERRIDERTERMFREGLLEEVEGLLRAGVRSVDPGMTGVGYRAAVEVVEGRMERDEAVRRTRQATRQYARRQQTWFRNQLPEGVLRVDGSWSLDERVDAVVAWWNRIGEVGQG